MSTSLRINVLRALTQLLVICSLLAPLQIHAAGSSDDSEEPDSSGQLKLAERLIYKEKYALAIKKLQQIVKADKQNADAWNLLGYSARKSGDTDTAANAYQQALSIDKDHLGALEYQGELFITLGKLDNANNNLNRLKELCPDGCDELEELENALVSKN